MKNSINPFVLKKQLETEIRKIPKQNRKKFFAEYIDLIKRAQSPEF